MIILLLVVQFSSAKTVDDVIERYLRARGGMDNLASVKSIYMEGIKDNNGREVSVKIIKEQDKLSRFEIETGVANGFVLVTDKAAWTFFPLRTPATNKIPDEDLSGLQTEMDIAGPLVDYIAKGHKAELIGKETVEDNTCYKIKLTTKEGKEMMFWVDATTYLVNQSSVLPTGGKRGAVTEIFTVYKNYKSVDGIQFAHTCQTKISGTNSDKVGGEIRFHEILVNPAIDLKMYQPE